jgi:putative MATE family efflux protein
MTHGKEATFMNAPHPALGRWNKEYTSVLLTVALPVMLQNLISIGLNLIDVLMVGRLGVSELAAVGAANRIYSVFGMICFGLISGFAVFIAQYWGVRDIRNIRRVYGLAMAAMLSIAIAFMLLAALAGRVILSLFLKDPAVVEIGLQYLNIALFSYPLVAYSFCTAFSSRSLRRIRVTTVINCIALSISTLLNYGLIFGNFGLPRLGVQGAAISTVIARALELTMLMIYIYGSREHPLAGKWRELFSFDGALVRKVMTTAWPVLVNEGFFTLGITSFYVAVSYLGTEAVAVMQVSMVVNDFFMATFFGLGNAVAVITGNELGRGEKELAFANGKVALKVTLALSLLIGGLLLSSRGLIVNIYALDPYTSAMLNQVLLVCAFYTAPRMLVYVLICGLLRAGGDTRFCMIVDVSSICLIGVPLAFIGVLALHWQLPAVLGLYYAYDLVNLVLCLRRFRSKVWINTLI